MAGNDPRKHGMRRAGLYARPAADLRQRSRRTGIAAVTPGDVLICRPVDFPVHGVAGFTIGAFDEEAAADACLKYVKTKFARALLGVLKITQHNPAKVWKYVPLQDFTSASDIDWTTPIPQIDQQLYAKYGLDANEIAFIEAHIKPMQ